MRHIALASQMRELEQQKTKLKKHQANEFYIALIFQFLSLPLLIAFRPILIWDGTSFSTETKRVSLPLILVEHVGK